MLFLKQIACDSYVDKNTVACYTNDIIHISNNIHQIGANKCNTNI